MAGARDAQGILKISAKLLIRHARFVPSFEKKRLWIN
jgi:hypothetical protein